jgi:hypothetical protein
MGDNPFAVNKYYYYYLKRVEKIYYMTMHGIMAKNVLADFVNENYQGVAVNVGFIAVVKDLLKLLKLLLLND